jgi:DNA-directed RNA polymerase subunit RPC12/RpoP
MIQYFTNQCPECGHKMAEDMLGLKWCPHCEGKRMAKEVSDKLRLNLKIDAKEVENPERKSDG